MWQFLLVSTCGTVEAGAMAAIECKKMWQFLLVSTCGTVEAGAMAAIECRSVTSLPVFDVNIKQMINLTFLLKNCLLEQINWKFIESQHCSMD